MSDGCSGVRPSPLRRSAVGGGGGRGSSRKRRLSRHLPKGKARVIEAVGVFYEVHVEGRKTPRQVPLAEVKDQIGEQLTAKREQARFAEWLQGRPRSARIQVYL